MLMASVARLWRSLQDPPLVVGVIILGAFLLLAVAGAAIGAEFAR